MITIEITVDSQTYTHELGDHTAPGVVARTVEQRLQGIPAYATGTARFVKVQIVQGGRMHRLLAPVADWWLGWSPWVRISCFFIAGAMLAVGLSLHGVY